jgi:AraC-like DNA-binding protein
LIRVRIQASAADLLQRDNSIRQLGEQAGFNDTHTFITAFKKLIGMTPQEFRIKYEFAPAEGMKIAKFMSFKSDVYLIDSFKEQ